MSLRWFVLVMLISFSVSCKQKYEPVPSNCIAPEKFVNILKDIRLAESNQRMLQNKGFSQTELLDSSYQIIFKIHNVSREKVMRSYNFYVQNPEWIDKMSADVLEELNKMER
ncbi:MAG: DUF4296 domain-containing protein [Bacteroidetes bacterium]|nr:DUF4296 domain-containing protein [Bacteroidota bacterium]